MKRKLLLFGLTLITLNLLNFSTMNAQSSKLSDGLSVKMGGGLTTFYGELGSSGLSILKNAKAGFSGSVIKMFNPVFGIQAQYTGGNLYSVRDDMSQYFNGFINEIGLSARLEILPMLAPSSSSRISPYLRAGLATTSFRTARRDLSTNTIYLPAYGFENDGLTKVSSVNALSIPLAGGLTFNVTDNIALEVEQSLSITNSDVLDALPGTANFNDMFGFTQIGLKYTINPIKRVISDPVTKTKTDRSTKSTRNNNNRSRRSNKQNTEDIEFAETNVFIESTIPDKPVSGKIFEVQIRINKGDYQGPGILTQVYPKGFTAIESILGTSQFSFVNQKVRVIWDQMPKDSIVSYSYMVRPSQNTRGSYAVNGNFEYKQALGPQVIHFANYLDIKNQIESGMDNQILSILDDKQKVKTDPQTQANKTQGNTNDLNIEELLREYGGENVRQEEKVVSHQETGEIAQHQIKQGAEFRIQIGAFKNRQQGQSVIRRYSLPETVIEESHNGLFKYTLGSFNTYREATNYRDQFIRRSQIWSAFIVGYRDGVRLAHITEAIK